MGSAVQYPMKQNKHFWNSVTVALAVGCVSVGASAADKMDTFSKLPATDILQVRFVSRGCFHFSTHELTFRRGATSTVAVVSVLQEWSDATKQLSDVKREELGHVTLTDSDLKGLDELLRFYRSSPWGGCTTTDTITISQVRDGKTIATEQFTDSSCSTYQMKDVTTLAEVVRRLEKKK